MIDLLQRVGLNKYEAEAYAALLRYGPLTGYELGKRSEVPLSRSYEILERLVAKGRRDRCLYGNKCPPCIKVA